MTNVPLPVTITVKQNRTVDFNPENVRVPRNQTGTITWRVAGAGQPTIGNITIGDGWPYEQPAATGQGRWQVEDPNDEPKTYKYSVIIEIQGEPNIEVDPSIVNEGKGPG